MELGIAAYLMIVWMVGEGKNQLDEPLDSGEFCDLASSYYDDEILGPFKERFTNDDETAFFSSFFEGSRLLDLGSGTGRLISLLNPSRLFCS